MRGARTVGRSRWVAAATALALGALSLAPSLAQAAWPGTNGPIVYAGDNFGGAGLFTMAPDGSQTTRISNRVQGSTFPSFSPAGTRIVFSGGTTYLSPEGLYYGTADIFTIAADGSGETQLTPLDPNDEQHPSFSPDGTQIVFMRFRQGVPGSDIYKMGADGSNPVRLTSDGSQNAQPVFSPDGTRIVFSSTRNGASEIYSMAPDGSNPVNLTNHPANDEGKLSFSPDGARIAFASDRDHGGATDFDSSEIYTMAADGSNQIRLTNNARWDGAPAFSPDGAQIAFASRNTASSASGVVAIFTMARDGANLLQRTSRPVAEHPDWGRATAGAPTSPLPVSLPGVSGLGTPGTPQTPRFSLASKVQIRRRGVSIVSARIPRAGVIKVAQVGVTRQKPAWVRALRVSVAKAATVKLTLRATHAGQRRLARLKTFSVKLRVTYTPREAQAQSLVKRVKLIR